MILFVFDVDGTIIDSIQKFIRMTARFLEAHGLPVPSDTEIGNALGFSYPETLRRLAPHLSEEELGALASEYALEDKKTHTFTSPADYPLYPHMDDILDYLTSESVAPHVKVALLSNKPHAEVHPLIETVLDRWAEKFAGVFGADPDRRPVKPDPYVLNLLMARERIPRDKVYMIGDMNIDVQTGKRAGVHSLAVLWGLNDKETLMEAHPDRYFDSQLGLLSFIQGVVATQEAR